MRNDLTLSELARAVGMRPGELATELKRGNIPGVPSNTGSPGKARYFNLRECVFVAIFAALRGLSASNKVLGVRAKYAAPQAADALGMMLLKAPPAGLGLAIIPRTDGTETLGLIRDERELARLATYAFGVGDPVQILPFTPIFQRLMDALAEANGVPPEKMERVAIGPEAAPTMPGATAQVPDVDEAPAPAGIIRDVPPDAVGMRVTTDGISVYASGVGVRQPMSAGTYRKLAQVCEQLANEMEATGEAEPPRPARREPARGFDLDDGAWGNA